MDNNRKLDLWAGKTTFNFRLVTSPLSQARLWARESRLDLYCRVHMRTVVIYMALHINPEHTLSGSSLFWTQIQENHGDTGEQRRYSYTRGDNRTPEYKSVPLLFYVFGYERTPKETVFYTLSYTCSVPALFTPEPRFHVQM